MSAAQHAVSQSSFTFAGAVYMAQQALDNRRIAAGFPPGSVMRKLHDKIARRYERCVRTCATAAMRDLRLAAKATGGAA